MSLIWRVVAGNAANAVANPRGVRYGVLRDVWLAAKRGGATKIRTVDIRDIRGMTDAVVEGYVDDYNRAVIAALCSVLECKTFFEIGTERGKTAWTVARNNSHTDVFTLDLPSKESARTAELEMTDAYLFQYWERGVAFTNTAEGERISQLYGDSALFDYEPYEGKMDLVYVDGSHSYSYVRNDTEAALRLLSPDGSVMWDDYPAYPGVYQYLNELAGKRPERFFHLNGTRLVICTRRDLGLDENGEGTEMVATANTRA